MPIERHGTTRRYSNSVTHNGTVYLVEVPGNADADFAAQAENLLASVERQLAEVGSDKSRLLLATIYLTDMADYDALNRIWEAWLPAGSAPVRACVEARLAAPAYRLEIVLTAALGGN